MSQGLRIPRVIHKDDEQSPFLSPLDPCQEPGCKRRKHIFAEHHNKRFAGVHGLSRWCCKHTIERGFCIRCAAPRIAHLDTGMCLQCEQTVNQLGRLYAGGANAKDVLREILRREGGEISPYEIRLD